MIRALARPAVRITQRRCASTSATTPAVQLQNIESRWATLSAQEQSSVAKHLEQIQAGEWTKMTTEQKKAGMESLTFSLFISFFLHLAGKQIESKGRDKQKNNKYGKRDTNWNTAYSGTACLCTIFGTAGIIRGGIKTALRGSACA